MGTKHTPGPWVAEKADQFGDHNIILGNAVEVGDYRAVAAVVSNMRNPEVVEANANLIAAAPELLEAARELADRYPLDPELTRLQLAIAAAELTAPSPSEKE